MIKQKTILITGSNGFIGKNLYVHLQNNKNIKILTFNKNDSYKKLEKNIIKSDFIIHLAGVNRSKSKQLFFDTNLNLTSQIVTIIKEFNLNPKLIFSSSVQVDDKNNFSNYSKSKKQAEVVLTNYFKKNSKSCTILRIPNVYGKWSKKNYNSVVSTFCFNIARNIKCNIIQDKLLSLLYIDDLVEFISKEIKVKKSKFKIQKNFPVSRVKVSKIYEIISNFEKDRKNLKIIKVNNKFQKNLYSTYLSYLPKNSYKYNLKENIDKRGNFIELIKSSSAGQFSFCTINPSEKRGSHYHNNKVEKFFVAKGRVSFRFKCLKTNKTNEFILEDKKKEIIESIPGQVHELSNLSRSEIAIVFVWTNEIFNPLKPDTYLRKI